MPIEPALLASAGRMPERASTERAKPRMGAASVRRDGMGDPEPTRVEVDNPQDPEKMPPVRPGAAREASSARQILGAGAYRSEAVCSAGAAAGSSVSSTFSPATKSITFETVSSRPSTTVWTLIS
jgi:hypothetical protein